MDPKTIFKKYIFLSPKKYGVPIKRNVLGSYIYHFLSIQARTTENTHPSAIRPTEPPGFGPWFVDSSGHCVQSLVRDAFFFPDKNGAIPKFDPICTPQKTEMTTWRNNHLNEGVFPTKNDDFPMPSCEDFSGGGAKIPTAQFHPPFGGRNPAVSCRSVRKSCHEVFTL